MDIKRFDTDEECEEYLKVNCPEKYAKYKELQTQSAQIDLKDVQIKW